MFTLQWGTSERRHEVIVERDIRIPVLGDYLPDIEPVEKPYAEFHMPKESLPKE